jgi:hypothetical protein
MMNGKSKGFFRKLQAIVRVLLCILCGIFGLQAEGPTQGKAPPEEQGYRIDKPGTITFTVGVKIKGKVEKPQVVIFLPKEKPVYRNDTLTHSFLSDLMQPLPMNPEEK